jgi:hypothetical protein
MLSFVITQPEALTAAAGNLDAIGSAIVAQNAAAAAPTTGVIPAAADEVSALQATQFGAYGNLYQQVSAQAAAIHEMFVNTLGASADSYSTTEAANAAAAGSSGSGLLGFFTGNGSYGLVPSALSNGAVVGAMQIGNFGSGASDLLQLGSAGFLAPGALAGAEVSGAGAAAPGGLGAATLTGAVEPAGPASFGGAPVSAVVGQAASVGRLSVPPSWAGQVAASSTPVPATLAGAGWTTAASNSTSVATMPVGMPSVASAGRGGVGFGLPRYGVKPTVMRQPIV